MKVRKEHRSVSAKRRIFLVDDHVILREGLTQLIDCEPDLVVCGEANDGPKAVSAVGRLKPDVVIVDLSLQDGSGLDLIKQIKALQPELPMLVLSMHDENLYAERALGAGALGYVMKREDGNTLLKAIRTVLAGEVFVSEPMRRRLLRKTAHHGVTADPSDLSQLSDRELEIFRMLGEGDTTGEIAHRLHVTVSTVETHYAHLREKLNLQSGIALRRAAVAWLRPQ